MRYVVFLYSFMQLLATKGESRQHNHHNNRYSRRNAVSDVNIATLLPKIYDELKSLTEKYKLSERRFKLYRIRTDSTINKLIRQNAQSSSVPTNLRSAGEIQINPVTNQKNSKVDNLTKKIRNLTKQYKWDFKQVMKNFTRIDKALKKSSIRKKQKSPSVFSEQFSRVPTPVINIEKLLDPVNLPTDEGLPIPQTKIPKNEIQKRQTLTFTTCGNYGPWGPAADVCASFYHSSPKIENITNTQSGFQTWKVPRSGTYEVTVAGAGREGPYLSKYLNSRYSGNLIRSQLHLNQDELLMVVVGQQGQIREQFDFGGSGGSFLFKNSVNGETVTMIVAGGGAGYAIIVKHAI